MRAKRRITFLTATTAACALLAVGGAAAGNARSRGVIVTAENARSRGVIVTAENARSRGVIVTASRIGPLRLDVSGPRAVLRFAGFPQSGGPYSLQYDCHPTSNGQTACRINYFFGRSGKYENRLIAAVLGAGPFQTRHATGIGTSKSVARHRERNATAATFCGQPVLRYPPQHPIPSAPYAGLNLGFNRGKVAGLVILSTHARLVCVAGGGFFIG